MKGQAFWIAVALTIAAGIATMVVVGFASKPKLHGSDAAATLDGSQPDDASGAQQDRIPGVPPADGFDFPVGPPDAKKYYNAQPFFKNHHLGEDWNGVGGGNTDLGDPVHAIAIGVVVEARDFGAGWGNVVRMYHNIGTKSKPRLIESLYAHLDTMLVHVGDTVQRGQKIGKIGNAHGAYWAHLHLEMRHDIHRDLGGGYGEDTTGYLVPTQFIKKHRSIDN